VKQNTDACAYIMTITKRIWERITWCKCKTCVRPWGKAQKRRSIPQPSSPSESPQTNEWATAWLHLNLSKSLLRLAGSDSGATSAGNGQNAPNHFSVK
ncbi:unnamed protein product, partial [Musa hybrid cultivar]